MKLTKSQVREVLKIAEARLDINNSYLQELYALADESYLRMKALEDLKMSIDHGGGEEYVMKAVTWLLLSMVQPHIPKERKKNVG